MSLSRPAASLKRMMSASEATSTQTAPSAVIDRVDAETDTSSKPFVPSGRKMRSRSPLSVTSCPRLGGRKHRGVHRKLHSGGIVSGTQTSIESPWSDGKILEVRFVGSGSDVDVLGNKRRPSQACADAADNHKPDSVFSERCEYSDRVELTHWRRVPLTIQPVRIARDRRVSGAPCGSGNGVPTPRHGRRSG